MAKKSQTKSNCKTVLSEKNTKTVVNKDGIPEFIEGIPTKRSASKERRELIVKYYDSLWKHLQREVKSNYIYNEYWQANIYVVKNESDKKTGNIASKNWKSTYAVKHLYEVVRNAKPLNGEIQIDKPKEGTQSKNGYQKILLLYHTFTNEKSEYLNFTVKITIGIRSDGKHVQYAINKIEC